MIKYNLNTINDWNFGDDNIIKVYRNNAVCYYKITGGGDTPTAQTPCFAVVDDISQYSDTEFEDVFNKADNKWYKLNNLNQYEEYGVYGSGRTICTGASFTELTDIIVQSTTALTNHNITVTPAVGAFSKIRIDTTKSATTSSYTWATFTPTPNGSEVLGINMDSIGAMNGYGNNKNYVTDANGSQTFAHWVDNNHTIVEIDIEALSNNQASELYLLFYQENCNPAAFSFYMEMPCVTTYDGKLTIDDGYEYMYSGGSWINVGEVSGSSKTSSFTIDDINNDVTVKSSISDGDYYVISYYKHNNPKEPQYMMSYQTSNNYLSNFSGYTGSNTITPSTIIDAAIWKFEATSTANTYYIKNIYNNLYWGYQTRASNRSLNLVGESDSSKAIVKVGVANSATTVGFVELNVNGSRYTYEDGTVGGYALNQLNGYTYRMNWWNTGGWGSDGNSAYYLYKIEGETIVYPVEYDEMQDPPNNLTFSSMTEAEAYECPWVGMQATINGDRYIFSGDSQSGYEWVYNPSRLPIGYTEVEYVQNTGTSYLNIAFTPNQDTRVVADMQQVTANNYPRLWGAGAWNSATGIMPNYEGGYLNMSWLGKTSWTQYTSVPTSFDRRVIDVNKNYLYVDSVQIGSNTYTTRTASDPIGVFTYIGSGRPSSSSYWGQEHFKGKMYSFKVYDNGTLVRDLVPCIRDNDNTVGAYDIVNDVFYTVPSGYTTDKLVAGNPI